MGSQMEKDPFNIPEYCVETYLSTTAASKLRKSEIDPLNSDDSGLFGLE